MTITTRASTARNVLIVAAGIAKMRIAESMEITRSAKGECECWVEIEIKRVDGKILELTKRSFLFIEGKKMFIYLFWFL